MKRLSLALTTIATTLAIAPYASATPSTEALQGNLNVETSVSEALAATTPDPTNVEATHIENLDRAETHLNQLPIETSGSATVLEVIVIEL
ncbi:MAG: hypothetical protein ACFB0C_00080 [Leptolyngbyaceae cyanobacterium]